MATFYARYPVTGGGGSVTSVNGQTGVVQLDAVDIPYDNTSSGLTATEVQGAIDELAAAIPNSLAIEYRTITVGEGATESLTLAAAPADPTKVILGIASAPTQVYGTDFIVTGSVLSWSTTALTGILTAGDEILLQYNV